MARKKSSAETIESITQAAEVSKGAVTIDEPADEPPVEAAPAAEKKPRAARKSMGEALAAVIAPKRARAAKLAEMAEIKRKAWQDAKAAADDAARAVEVAQAVIDAMNGKPVHATAGAVLVDGDGAPVELDALDTSEPTPGELDDAVAYELAKNRGDIRQIDAFAD